MMSLLNDWALEKYARTTKRLSNDQEEWEIMESTPSYSLMLILTKTGSLTVEVGGNILEYYNLMRNRQVRVEVRDGVCLLFVCTGQEMRKWLIKFTGGTHLGEINCTNCHQYIKSFLDPPTRVLPLFPNNPCPPTINPNGKPGTHATSTATPVGITTNSVTETALHCIPGASAAADTSNIIGVGATAVSSAPAVANTTNPIGFGAAALSSASTVANSTNPFGIGAAALSSASTVANSTNPFGIGAAAVSSAPAVVHDTNAVFSSGMPWVSRPTVAYAASTLGTVKLAAFSSAPAVTNATNVLGISGLTGALDTPVVTSTEKPVGTAGLPWVSNTPAIESATIPLSNALTRTSNAPAVASIQNPPGEFGFPWALSAPAVAGAMNPGGPSGFNWTLNTPSFTNFNSHVGNGGLPWALNMPGFPNTLNPAGTPIAIPPIVDVSEPSKKRPRKSRAPGTAKKGRPPKVPETPNASVENVFTTVSTAGCSNAFAPPVYSASITNDHQPPGSDTTNMDGKVVLGDLYRSVGEIPDLEQMVQLVLQDPKLPDLVEAVHKVISNM